MYQAECPAYCLTDWVEHHCDHPGVAAALLRFAGAATHVARLVALGPLVAVVDGVVGDHAPGDAQQKLGRKANQLFVDALRDAPVTVLLPQEDGAETSPNRDAPLVVTIDPFDRPIGIDGNMPLGTIMSIVPNPGSDPDTAVLQPGTEQLAAAFVMYGPQTTLALTFGQGTHIFMLDSCSGDFILTRADVQIPPHRYEYAIDASNYRHWDEPVRAYIDDCNAGVDGPQGGNFEMFWTSSTIAEALRICIRGGIFLHPRDNRTGHRDGRLHLIHQANPIALLIEQAGGLATDGEHRILGIVPHSIHQRAPLVFGSRDNVESVARYHADRYSIADRWPLFGHRGLFKV